MYASAGIANRLHAKSLVKVFLEQDFTQFWISKKLAAIKHDNNTKEGTFEWGATLLLNRISFGVKTNTSKLIDIATNNTILSSR